MRNRLAAMVLVFESITCGLAIPVAAMVSESSMAARLLTGMAVMCLLTAGLLRRSFGIALGWAVQICVVVVIVFVPAFAFVGIPFALLWWLSLRIGGRIDLEREQRHGEAAAG